MITTYAAKAVHDNLMEGAAKLGLTMSMQLLSTFKCDSFQECKLSNCPLCGAGMNMRLLEKESSQIGRDFEWRKHVYAFRDLTIAGDDDRCVNLDPLRKLLGKALDGWARSARSHEDEPKPQSGCVATYGIVQDLGSETGRDKVVVVEIVVTGDPIDDFEIQEPLLRHGENVHDVPVLPDNDYRLVPNQGLLFGYTKRNLRVPDRPKVIYSKPMLARMYSNYAGSPDSLRFLSRGLACNDRGWQFSEGIDKFSPDIFPII
jgi:hypothetical protein